VQLKAALHAAIQRLGADRVPSPRLNAELLLMFTLNCDRAYLHAHPERELTIDERDWYKAALKERSRGVPAQYITGHQEFWGLDFVVTPAVLIPRPETEHLVETVLELARGVPSPKIVDVGTGSGCIALSLAHELKGAEVYAVDLSADALEIARANAARLQLDGRVKFAQCDVLTPVQNEGVISSAAKRSRATSIVAGITLGDFDFVVSNPPYVGFDEADKVQKSVRDFEPRVAVFSGERGLDVIGPLIEQAHAALTPEGWLAMEIGYSMRDAVVNLLDAEKWEDVRVVPDLQGIPRVVAGRKRRQFQD
jgi:release factor glutamine methyltransferase